MLFSLSTRGHFQKLLLRGDCEGRVAIWTIPEVSEKFLMQIQQETTQNAAGSLIQPIIMFLLFLVS